MNALLNRQPVIPPVPAAATGLALAAILLFLGRAAGTDSTTKRELKDQGFVELFDGKTLSGWEANESPESWTIQPDGSVRGQGRRSHLFSLGEFTDVHFRVDVKTTQGSNGGIYVRAKKTTEFPFPPAYEAQVNNTARARHRTGSLYVIGHDGKWITPVQFEESPVRDGEWWTEEIIIRGHRIVIKVNGRNVAEFEDTEKTHARGRLALQLHDAQSTVFYKNAFVKDLAVEK